jgi:hypothetical protein
MADFSGLLNQMTIPDDFSKKPAPSLFSQLGILSPSEKAKQQMEQNQAMQAQFILQQQLQAQAQSQAVTQQTNIANAKSNVPTGFNFSTFLGLGGAQNLSQADQLARQAQGGQQGANNITNLPSTGQDQSSGVPEQIITSALQQYPNDKAKAFRIAGQQLAAMGQANQRQDLMSLGANLIDRASSADKEQEELKNKQVDTQTKQVELTGKQGALDNPGNTFQGHDPDGNMVTYQPQFKDGKYTGLKVVTAGPNKQITQSGDLLTPTQAGEEAIKMKDLIKNTDATVSAMRDISSNLKKGAAQGWAGSGVGFMNNIKGTLEQLASNNSYSPAADAALKKFAPDFQEWANKTGVNDSIWNDLVSNLAKTYNPTGTITEKDITRAAKTVGQNISNPSTVAAVLEDAERRSKNFVDTSFQYSGKRVQEGTKEQYDMFKGKFAPGATGPEDDTDMKDSNPAEQEPNWDNAPAGTPSPKTEKEYDALPAGTKYWNPYLRKVVPKR